MFYVIFPPCIHLFPLLTPKNPSNAGWVRVLHFTEILKKAKAYEKKYQIVVKEPEGLFVSSKKGRQNWYYRSKLEVVDLKNNNETEDG